MERPIVLRRARIVADLDADKKSFQDDAGLVLEKGRVALLGTTKEADAWARSHESETPDVHDLHGKVVFPGLVNAHTHLYSTLARGMPLLPGKAPPPDFKAILEEIWWPLDRALDEEDVHVSAVLGLIECARAGVTTIVDHHASEFAIEGSLDLVARAAREVGVRVATCFEVTDRDGDGVARRGIEENVRFARALAASPRLGGAPQVAATFGLHAALTLGDETLALARDARERAKLPGFHVHVAESRFDPEDAKRRAELRTVERLARAGVLGEGTIAAHAVHVDDRERSILRETNTLVVTNPSSNRNNAVGRADVAALRKKNVAVAIGTDGMSPDILGEVAQLFLSSKDQAQDPRAGRGEAISALATTKLVANALFGDVGIGTLSVGAPADVTILDYVPWTPLDGGNWIDHVIYGGLGARVDSVLVGGKWVVRGGELPHLDLERLSAKGRERARAMWARRAPPR